MTLLDERPMLTFRPMPSLFLKEYSVRKSHHTEEGQQWLARARSETGRQRRPSSGARERQVRATRYAVVSYEITSEPLTDLPENKLPPDLAAHVERLYQLTHSSPRDAIVELKQRDRTISRLSQALQLSRCRLSLDRRH